MRVRCAWLALALLGLMGLTTCVPPEPQADSESKAARSPAKSSLQRQRTGSSSGSSWRLVLVLAQSQPTRLEVQRAWEEAVQELAHTEVELAYVDARALLPPQLSPESSSHPTALLNRFCGEIKLGKTALVVIVGGGAAARFLVTASSAMRLPALWMPISHRDFIRQGRATEFESRVGVSSEEMGAAAAALMHKAHWHAFTLLIDANLLPVKQLVRKEHPLRPGQESSLRPRSVVYLPADEKTLAARLRRVAEENGRGSVIVLGCDLNNARKVIALAGKYEMLAGRFLWLWLDLKAELRSNEPNIIGTHLLHNARVSVTSDHIPAFDSQEFGPNLSPESDVSVHTLSNLASEIHKMQEFSWHSDMKAAEERKPKKKRESPSLRPGASAPSAPFLDPDDEELARSGVGGNGLTYDRNVNSKSFMPLGMLALRPANARMTGGPDTLLARAMRETAQALDKAMLESRPRLGRLTDGQLRDSFVPECLPSKAANFLESELRANVSSALTRQLRESARQISSDKAEFHLLNLQGLLFPGNKTQLRWTKVGTVRAGREVRLDTIIWPGGGIVPAYIEEGREKIGMPSYKIVTALAPPFAMITNLQEGTCLRGLTCKHGNVVKCCYGYSMDLLYQVSQDLEFRFDLHVAKDGLFGRRRGRNGTWNGVVGELVTGKAQLAFAPLSVYSHRSQVVDFTTPYYFSSVSFLTAPKERNAISLLAFLQPFSPELWIAVFTSLNITAMFVAAYEWFSPFGLNPWGRQRSKNFSIASALWVTWGLLCGHLVAFKAPKSWPNKFLINMWGGFSVIFVASYTANIAALIAGLFFHNTGTDYYDRSLLAQKVAAPKASAAEYYVMQANPRLWSYMSRYSVLDVADGVQRLLNGSLDILIADTPIIDYYQATDNGCRLEKVGDSIKEDTYAVALSKGHPLKESISKIIANYTSTGFLDILQEKWYGGLPCMRGAASGIGYDGQPRPGGQPRPLGVASVAGVFCLLGLGMTLGVIILVGEHIFYKYSLPKLRQRPKNSMWRSRNVMFFSQKLYRFINCVELVSPHHAARELMHTVRQGQITSLFQKSVKRKEHEQRRRRKSKAQFFEMIQEIRRTSRVQQEEKVESAQDESKGAIKKDLTAKDRGRERSRSKSPMMLRGATSPRQRAEKSRSSTNLAGSRLGLAQISVEGGPAGSMKPREFTLSSSNLRARSPLELVGRRLSHGDGQSPPPTPKLGSSNFGGSANLRAPQRGESVGAVPSPRASRSPAKRGQSFPVFATLRTPQPADVKQHYQVSRSPLLSPNSELTCAIGRKLSREWGSGVDVTRSTEAISASSTFTLNQEPRASEAEASSSGTHRRKKSAGDEVPLKKPIRRARSHENKDTSNKFGEPPPKFPAQPVVGGQSVSERTKKQLESELKAILTARAHHFELHPP
ncbi:uncharacterized protein LOC100123912 isoform X4 [Nasonia vitripennis]|uniref:Glutamate [NMDA] receptor subunit 3A n=1 Tax=Nasonia vitripennis TaxID=7425 RepID=A0A7M7IYQ4_NASVI|nr:uncharacterized protein LOC100123912 isoform X4 [Nasonia vitripennis]